MNLLNPSLSFSAPTYMACYNDCTSEYRRAISEDFVFRLLAPPQQFRKETASTVYGSRKFRVLDVGLQSFRLVISHWGKEFSHYFFMIISSLLPTIRRLHSHSQSVSIIPLQLTSAYPTSCHTLKSGQRFTNNAGAETSPNTLLIDPFAGAIP